MSAPSDTAPSRGPADEAPPTSGRVGQLRADHPQARNLVHALYLKWQLLVHEVAKFGTVGAVCAVIDIGGFNLLHVAPFHLGPLTSKGISTVVAATCAYIGNRHWSFRHRARTGVRREYTLFFVLNAVGLAIAEAVLGFSHYVLGLHSALADNIAANVVGLGLGTLFRFWSYKRWVFLAPDTMGAVVSDIRAQESDRPQ